MTRLRELDFLRGIAIILVLFRHKKIFLYTTNMGWIGVDLFFVLSGFLVSGLLFKEYLKFGNIHASRFLIRRGFKIYPVYFLFYILYLFPILYQDRFYLWGFISDMTFLQNYINGWGFANGASWSLAVEEHFYFGLAFFLWFGVTYNKIQLLPHESQINRLGRFEISILVIMICCLLMRVASNYYFPDMHAKNFTMTHLRIDSLLAGVLIAYLYYFKGSYLASWFQKNKHMLLPVTFMGLAWTPFINPVPSVFVKTIGFSLLYLSFGALLIWFLLTPTVNQKLNRLLSEPVVNVISKIGYCSYSIYIIHLFINSTLSRTINYFDLYNNVYLNFGIAIALSILSGMWMTYKVENYFLKIRNKYYPGRV